MEEKAHEGCCPLSVQMLTEEKNGRREQNPEVEASANHKRVAASARMYDSAAGKRP